MDRIDWSDNRSRADRARSCLEAHRMGVRPVCGPLNDVGLLWSRKGRDADRGFEFGLAHHQRRGRMTKVMDRVGLSRNAI